MRASYRGSIAGNQSWKCSVLVSMARSLPACTPMFSDPLFPLDRTLQSSLTRTNLTLISFPAGRLGPQLPLRHNRRYQSHRRTGIEVWHPRPCGRLPRGLRFGLHGASGFPSAPVRLPRTWGDQHIRGHPQVRLRSERDVCNLVFRSKIQALPVLRHHRLARRRVRVSNS